MTEEEDKNQNSKIEQHAEMLDALKKEKKKECEFALEIGQTKDKVLPINRNVSL